MYIENLCCVAKGLQKAAEKISPVVWVYTAGEDEEAVDIFNQNFFYNVAEKLRTDDLLLIYTPLENTKIYWAKIIKTHNNITLEAISTGGGAGGDVISVNGKNGVVILSATDILNQAQLDAVNSGITAEKVAGYDGLSTDINNLSTEVATNKTDIATLKTDVGDIGDSITDLRNDKQDKLTAGNNITITEDGVISATGGGTGSNIASDITYSNTECGLNDSNVQDALDEVDVKVNEAQGDIKDLIDTKNDLSQYDVIKVKSTSPNLIELNKEYIGCLKLATDYNILDIISKNAGLADDTEVIIAKISYNYNTVDYEKILKLRYKVSNTAYPYYVLFTDLNGVETELILFDTRGASHPTIRTINVLSDMAYDFKITEFNSIAELELKDILKVDNIQSVFVDGDKDAIIKNFNLNSTNYSTLGIDIAVGNYGPIAVQNGYNPKSQGIIFNLPNGKVLQLSYSDENGLALKPFSSLSSGPNVWGSNLFKFVTLGSAITDMSSLPTGEFSGSLIKIFDVPDSATNQPEGLTAGGYCVWTGNGLAGHNTTKCVGTLTFYPLSGGIYFKTFYGWTGSLKASANWQKIATTTV